MDKIRSKQIVSFALLLGTLIGPISASAEWYADLYGGGAFTQDMKYRQIRGEGLTLDAKLNVDNSFTVGGRTGYWFEGLPWLGIGLDVFYFEPSIPEQSVATTGTFMGVSDTAQLRFRHSSISVIAIGFDVLRLRLPLLKSLQYPHGQLQPYITAGPALFITRAEDSANVFSPSNQSKTDTSLGLKVGGGAAFHITRALALFGEYRFTHFKADATFRDQNLDENNPPVDVTTQMKFDTHHVIAGLSFRF